MDNSNAYVTGVHNTTIVAAVEDASGLEEVAPGADAPAIPPKRPQGRPKGLGRVPGSGRKKGTANKVTQDVRDYIMDKGKPLELLFKICAGNLIKVGDADGGSKKVYPSLADRATAARVLLAKVLPDMKATEITGADGGAVEIVTDGGLAPMAEVARRLSFIMASGDAAAGVTVETQPLTPLQPEPLEQSIVEVPVDPLRRPENQRADNRAVPTRSDRPQVITRRR